MITAQGLDGPPFLIPSCIPFHRNAVIHRVPGIDGGWESDEQIPFVLGRGFALHHEFPRLPAKSIQALLRIGKRIG
jgi:hypothetical protein